MVRTKDTEWKVRIQHPNGNWAQAPVVGAPTRNPRVNGLPDIQVPVSKNLKWDKAVWVQQPMQVWFRGERQNVEQLERVEQRQDSTMLVGRGGVELRNIVDDEYEFEESTTVADNLITQNTSYTANVDNFAGATDENVTLDTVTTTSEFQNATTLQDTDPFIIQNGNLELAQSAFHLEAENLFLTSEGTDSISSEGAFENIATQVSDNDSRTVNYTIPQGDSKIAIRVRNPNDPDNDTNFEGFGFLIRIDGNSIGGFADNWQTSTSDYGWRTFNIGADVSGSTNIEIDGTNGSGELTSIDLIVLYDDRYNYFFDNSVNANGYLDGPELYPDSAQIEHNNINTARAVTGGRLESTWDDTSNNQQVALSNDNGANYTTANNTDTFETDFADAGLGLRLRTQHSRYGTQSSTPTDGVNGQKIQDYTLKADLSNIPFVINKAFNESVNESLDYVATTGDFVWEFQIANDGTKSVEFTVNEQRNVSDDVEIIDFNVKKDAERIIDKVIVFGGNKSVQGETITADTGTSVPLANQWLVEGNERVTDGSGTEYDRGVDFDITYNDGTITALSGGDISNGQTLEVDYDWKIRETQSNNVADPFTKVFRFSGITTPELAQVVANRLQEELSQEKKTVDVTIPADIQQFSPINAIDFTEVPVDEIAQVEEVQGTPDNITVRAGTRESLSSLQREITTQLRSLSDRV